MIPRIAIIPSTQSGTFFGYDVDGSEMHTSTVSLSQLVRGMDSREDIGAAMVRLESEGDGDQLECWYTVRREPFPTSNEDVAGQPVSLEMPEVRAAIVFVLGRHSIDGHTNNDLAIVVPEVALDDSIRDHDLAEARLRIVGRSAEIIVPNPQQFTFAELLLWDFFTELKDESLGPGIDEEKIARGDDKMVGIIFDDHNSNVRLGVQYSVSALGESLDIVRESDPVELKEDQHEFSEDLDLTLEIENTSEFGEAGLSNGSTVSVRAGFSKYRALSEELEGSV